MTTRSGKSGKKDDVSTDNICSSMLTLEAMTELLERHNDSLSAPAEFKSHLGKVDSKLDQICSLVEDHSHRISSLEEFSNDSSQRLHDLESLCSELQVETVSLRANVIDLEGRSRRQNIQIIGQPEKMIL